MPVWYAALLGVVQGLTEFLPVSSSGHLVLLQSLIGLDPGVDRLLLDTWLHLGTLVSVMVCFWDDIRALARAALRLPADGIRAMRGRPSGTPEGASARRLLGLLAAASLPLAAAPFLSDRIGRLFRAPAAVGIMLLVTAALLTLADRTGGVKTEREAAVRDALTVGVFQLAALMPGLSRSGATIAGGALRGFTRAFAVRFSFLLSVPVILAANLATLPRLAELPRDPAALSACAVGMLTAALSGMAAITLVRRLSRAESYRPFSVYCACAGIAVLVLSLTGRL